MQEHEQARTAKDDHALEQAAIHEPEAAVEQQPQAQAQAVPRAASFAELTGQPAVEQAGPRPEDPAATNNTTALTDAVIEQLAHGMVAKELDDNDEKFLAAQGYKAMPIIRGVHEFVMRSFVPTQAG